MRFREKNELLDANIDIAKFCVIARPTFRRCEENGAQDFAALDSRCWLLRFGGLGMKGAGVLRQFAFGCDRGERAMIRDCNPGADRRRNNNASRARFHAVFNRSPAANAQTFSSGSTFGATPAATSDGGIPSSPGAKGEVVATGACSRRVDISMAVKSRAAAR